MFSRKKIMYVH